MLDVCLLLQVTTLATARVGVKDGLESLRSFPTRPHPRTQADEADGALDPPRHKGTARRPL